MSNVIKLPQLAWHDPKELELPLLDGWQIEIRNMAGYNRPALTDEQIEASVTNPIGTAPIRDLARGKKEVVIIFDDMARVTRVGRIVPYVLEELKEASIHDSAIRFIAATGTHAPMDRIDFAKKLGEGTLARFPVYNHNIYENCTYVGTTSRGTRVSINAEVMQCDLKIAIGSVTPHISTVFSGGGKMILPGVASIETIEHNHKLPLTEQERDNYEINHRRLDMEEAAKLAGLDVIIDCIVNMWGDTVAIFAGAETPAHEASVKYAKTHYLTTKAQDKHIVIANTFAKVTEAATALKTEASVSQEGGDFVLIANAPEGQVVHYLMGPWGQTIGGRLRMQFPVSPHINHFIVYSKYPDIASLGWFEKSDRVLPMGDWDDVLGILQESHGDSATVALYPNADIQYFG